MVFRLSPDENGVVVFLTDVSDDDASKLEAAEKHGFDPTDEPFNKYYAYDKDIGFYVDKSHFDHAEHKGKRLSFSDYMSIISNGEAIVANDAIEAVKQIKSAKDADLSIDLLVDKVNDVKLPKDAKDAVAALNELNYVLKDLALTASETADEKQKDKLHKAVNHAFDVYNKANDILFKSDFAILNSLVDATSAFRQRSANVQATLREKFNENF